MAMVFLMVSTRHPLGEQDLSRRGLYPRISRLLHHGETRLGRDVQLLTRAVTLCGSLSAGNRPLIESNECFYSTKWLMLPLRYHEQQPGCFILISNCMGISFCDIFLSADDSHKMAGMLKQNRCYKK
jgi:hypothetical protein